MFFQSLRVIAAILETSALIPIQNIMSKMSLFHSKKNSSLLVRQTKTKLRQKKYIWILHSQDLKILKISNLVGFRLPKISLKMLLKLE